LSRSVEPDEVLRQLRRLADAGYLEIVLTGIHLGSYGHDLRPKRDLTRLLEAIESSRLVPRVRLSSLDPREVSDPLLDRIADSEVICPHLHICAQAGDDEILKRMRRNYDSAYYRDLLSKIRERLPDAALGSDIIIGFPGETDAAFERSLNFFAALPLTYFHVFPYSARRGTIAAGFAEQVPGEIKRRRAFRMRELGRKQKAAFMRRFIGRRLPVLVEEQLDKKTRQPRGYSRNYLPVIARGGAGFVNREVLVTVSGIEGEWLSATIGTGAADLEQARVADAHGEP
jgi:threonylcarbamoyladenosine tRNA methylthiotransferase MtaB